MTTIGLRSFARRASVLALLAAPSGLAAQTRAFLVLLGADTVAIERIARSGERIEGTLLRHAPATSVLRYAITLNRDGTVASYEQATLRADGSPMPNAPTGQRLTFSADSVTREQTPPSGQPTSRRTAVPKGTIPAIGAAGSSWQFYELGVQQARRDGSGGFNVIGFGAQQNTAARIEVRAIGADSVELGPPYTFGIRLDRGGQITRGDGSKTTQKLVATVLRDVDVDAIAAAWAAKDAAGQAIGILSTRDSVSADIGGAHIVINYGRPAKRGREIWGKLVPFDTTWRLGANAATQFKTDKDLDLGGVTVPAGSYTLWLYPTAGASYLIVNKQVVDARGVPLWGTNWDPAQDLVRVPLEQHMNLPMSEERFRIFFQGDMLMFHWDRGGYGVRVRVK